MVMFVFASFIDVLPIGVVGVVVSVWVVEGDGNVADVECGEVRVVEFAVQWGYVFDGGLGYGLPKDDEFLMGCECCVVHG